MVIISYGTIRDFIIKFPDAADSLNNWYTVTEKSDWANFNELRNISGSADSVGDDLYVFNIRGNRYRLIARIIFRVRTVFIRFVVLMRSMTRLN